MQRFWRWLAVKLMIRSCLDRTPEWREDHRSYYLVNRRWLTIVLIGQAPGTCYTLGGHRSLVLLGEGVQYLPKRTVLRSSGAFFLSDGLFQVKPGPGTSWLWMVQFGAFSTN